MMELNPIQNHQVFKEKMTDLDQIKEIVTDIDKLRTVHFAPVRELQSILDVLQSMAMVCDSHNGAGLSAVQIGVPWKLSIVKIDKNLYRAFVNCSYKPDKRKGQFRVVEGCLSIPGKLYSVKRWAKIRLTGYEFDLNEETSEASLKKINQTINFSTEDVLSTVIQHEIDHQNGILISDIGDETSQAKDRSYNFKSINKHLLNLAR